MREGMEKKMNKKTGLQNRDTRGMDQDIRLSCPNDDGLFEWMLPDGTIEMVDAKEFKARGGRIVLEGVDGDYGVKIVKEGIHGYQQVK